MSVEIQVKGIYFDCVLICDDFLLIINIAMTTSYATV